MKRESRIFRSIILLLFFSVFCLISFADRIVYSYDSSGNRTLRQKYIPTRGTVEQSENESDSDSLSEELTPNSIKIYPNPTDGIFSVEIIGMQSPEDASITIYNMTGVIVYYNDQLKTTNEIDLTSCPSGIYLLITKVDGKTGSWKVLKN